MSITWFNTAWFLSVQLSIIFLKLIFQLRSLVCRMSGGQITRIILHWPVQTNTMEKVTHQYGWGDGWHIMEIQSSPYVSTPVFPPGLYTDVSSVCAVWDVGTPVQWWETPVQGPETPVQGPEAPSPQLPLSGQEQLASPWAFSSSEITKGAFKSTNNGALCIASNYLSNIFLVNLSFGWIILVRIGSNVD